MLKIQTNIRIHGLDRDKEMPACSGCLVVGVFLSFAEQENLALQTCSQYSHFCLCCELIVNELRTEAMLHGFL